MFRIQRSGNVGSMIDEQTIALVEDEEPVVPQWERAECTCPDWCERDHELD